MIQVIKSEDRGLSEYGWLNSRHTFSFGHYYNEKRMGFGPLRVINEDCIQGGTGFDRHGHRNMEIISYVIEGALAHKDSTGTEAVIRPGEIQRMSAGTGVEHSEYNDLKDQNTHFLQIWIVPEQLEIEPSYEQKVFENDFGCSDFVLVGSKHGRNGSVMIHQDVDLYICKSKEAGEKHYKTFEHRHLWLQIIKGNVSVEATDLTAGDGAGIKGLDLLKINWNRGSEFLFFDLPS